MIRRRALAAPLWTVVLPLAVVAIAVAYPLGRFLATPLFPTLAPPAPEVRDGQDPYLLAAVIDSVRIGLEAGAAALAPAFLIAFVLERRSWWGGPLLIGCVWALFLTPSYLLTAGWQILVGQPGLRDGPAHTLLYSEAGIVALLALKGLPFATLTARAGWSVIGGEIGAAARVHVRERWRRAAITGRLLAPVATGAFAIVFVEGIGDFGVSATLGAQLHLPLVVYGVYVRLSRLPVDFVEAARLSLILVGLSGLAVAAHQAASRGGHQLVGGRSRPAPRPPLGRAGSAAAGLLLVVLLLGALAAPALAILVQATAGGVNAVVLPSEGSSLLYSAGYALVGSVLSLALAAAFLSLTSRAGAELDQALDGLTLAAMAVPGLVLGSAYVIAFNGWLPLYGSPMLLLAAYVVTHLPVLMRLLQAPLRATHASLTDAARIHALSWRARLEQVHAPLLLRPLLWGWAIAFAGIYFELPLSALLHPAGRPSIGVQLLGMEETLRFAAEARLAAAGAGVCLLVTLAGAVLLPLWLAAPGRGRSAQAPA